MNCATSAALLEGGSDRDALMATDWYLGTPSVKVKRSRRASGSGAGMTERPVQRGAIRLLACQRIEAVAVPNGAHLAGNKLARVKQMAALRKDGLRPGFPDLILFGRLPLQVGFIECKREIGNDLSDVQEDWRDILTGLGFPWAMIRQPEEALAAVREWGWIK